MSRPPRPPRANRFMILVASALAVAGLTQLSHPDTASGPPHPATDVLGSLPPPTLATSRVAPDPPAAAMTHSIPTHIDIPAINIHAAIITVGLNADDSLGTPPLNNAKVAGWYDRGPAPGENGSAIIDAHVDSALMSDYRGAFFYLGQAKPGMRIEITRADHTIAEFTIDEVQVALKTQFPTSKVYAATTYPALRLITCGGTYDKTTHEYLGNTIVYAHLATHQ